MANANGLDIKAVYHENGVVVEPDYPILVSRGCKVIQVMVIELDTDEHLPQGGVDSDTWAIIEQERVCKLLDGYKASHGQVRFPCNGNLQAFIIKKAFCFHCVEQDTKVMVVHFNMHSKSPPAGMPTDKMDRWLVMRQWAADYILNGESYPSKCALYLNYTPGHKNIGRGTGDMGCGVCKFLL